MTTRLMRLGVLQARPLQERVARAPATPAPAVTAARARTERVALPGRVLAVATVRQASEATAAVAQAPVASVVWAPVAAVVWAPVAAVEQAPVAPVVRGPEAAVAQAPEAAVAQAPEAAAAQEPAGARVQQVPVVPVAPDNARSDRMIVPPATSARAEDLDPLGAARATSDVNPLRTAVPRTRCAGVRTRDHGSASRVASASVADALSARGLAWRPHAAQGACETDQDCIFRASSGCCGMCLAKDDLIPPGIPCGAACAATPPAAVSSCSGSKCPSACDGALARVP